MTTQIVLLRGVMPTGKNRVPMAQLREVLTRVGFENVRTYIQSGNVLVDSERPPAEVASQVRALIRSQIGPDLVVLVRSGAQLQAVLDRNPFVEGYNRARLFYVLLAEPPSAIKVAALLAEAFGDDQLAITDEAAYLYIPGTYGGSRLSNNYIEKRLGVSATMRNYNTLSALIALSQR